MKAWHHPLVALGLLAPACSAASAPPAQRASTGPTAPLHPLIAADEAVQPEPATTTTTEPAPVTTVTVSKLPPTTRGTTVTTLTVRTTLPEYADEPMGDIEWLIRQTFPETPDKAVRVARCESKLNPRAISPTSDYGLMQVNIVHRGLASSMGYRWEQMLEVMPNLAVARAIYDDAGGWGPWTCA